MKDARKGIIRKILKEAGIEEEHAEMDLEVYFDEISWDLDLWERVCYEIERSISSLFLPREVWIEVDGKRLEFTATGIRIDAPDREDPGFLQFYIVLGRKGDLKYEFLFGDVESIKEIIERVVDFLLEHSVSHKQEKGEK